MDKRNKKFLKLPRLYGGREALKAFVRANLRYPPQALEKGIQGDVIVRFRVTGKGEVREAVVAKGLGYGCDEEALRLVGMLTYQAVKNRGVKVVANHRIRIPFRIRSKPGNTRLLVSYSESAGGKNEKTGERTTASGSGESGYTFTIRYTP